MPAFSRRRVLRGLGALVALPALEITGGPGRTAARSADGAGPPLRLACIYTPNGKNMAHWTPAGEGAGYALSRALKPLEDVRGEFQVISGLKHDKARANGDGGGDHARANATFLTGAQARKTSGADIRNGISADQVAARGPAGRQTRLPSLELTCDEARRAGNCDSGYSCSYQFNLAWKNETTPLAPERDPRLVFERLFGSPGGGAEEETARARRAALQQSVLDYVMEDARAFQKGLGYEDRQRMEEYLGSVRDLERRLARAAGQPAGRSLPDFPRPAGIPQDYADHIRLMFDLQALAFRTDSTRISTFLLAHDGSNRTFPSLGVRDSHHGISHHQGDPDKLEKLALIDEFYSSEFARFLRRLREIPEGGGTLLDHCLILFGGGISDPDSHSHDDLPVLLAGGGGGTLPERGRHLKLRTPEPMCNLHLSLLHRMGVPAERFGDSTGLLRGIG